MAKTKTDLEHNLNIRLDDDLQKALEKWAASVGESISTIVRMALRERAKTLGYLK